MPFYERTHYNMAVLRALISKICANISLIADMNMPSCQLIILVLD